MKTITKQYLLCCVAILMGSCNNSTERIDYIADDYQMAGYHYIFSEKGILKSIHSQNSQIILYDTEFNEIARIESFNYGAYFISDFGKDTIEISFLEAKSSFESTNFINDVVELGDYKISYRFYDLKRFSNSGEEIIDSIYFEKEQYRIQLFRNNQLISNVSVKNLIFNKKEILHRTISGNALLFTEYICSKDLTPDIVLKSILEGYKNK
jgi:hypothetical protein